MRFAGYTPEAREKKPLPKLVKALLRLLIGCALTVSFLFFAVDYIRIKRDNKPPVFCIKAIEHESGSVDYYGFLYKVWKDYDPFERETEYYITFWFFPKFLSI
ncbi:MAG: hypothetical protein FWG90_05470 [Oscillospiraceae bacterium]|nr:hypothetical protein [Oscillospiraceae bacterium]